MSSLLPEGKAASILSTINLYISTIHEFRCNKVSIAYMLSKQTYCKCAFLLFSLFQY